MKRVQSSFKLQDGTTAPAIVDLLPLRQTLCIHIRADDAMFEDTIISLKHKIDVVSHLNGMSAGPGPKKLYALRADFSFGEPLQYRPEWGERIEWEKHPCGFKLSQDYRVLPLSQRLMREPNSMREVEFPKIVRLP